jgi:ribosomal protein L22
MRATARRVDVDNLVMSEAYVNEGPRRSGSSGADGRAYRYQQPHGAHHHPRDGEGRA